MRWKPRTYVEGTPMSLSFERPIDLNEKAAEPPFIDMYYPPASLIITGILFGVICVGFTSLRWWVRLSYCRAPVGLDDWCIVVGALMVTTLADMQVDNTINGQASQNTNVVRTAYVAHQIDYAQCIIEKVAYGCTKLSLLFFYRRLFGVWSAFKKLNNFMITLVIVWMVVYLFGEIFACGIHPQILWNDHIAADYMCMDHGAFLVSFAATDVVTDIMVLSTPFPYIQRLRLSTKQKWAVSGVFVMGFISTLAGIIRLSFLAVCYSVGQFTWNPPPFPNPPKVMKVINPIFWTNVELTCGVIAANLPVLWPLIRNTPRAAQFYSWVYTKVSALLAKYRNSNHIRSNGETPPESPVAAQVVTEKVQK